nr:ATP-binding cassette domain-containing protein [Aliamphritea spongicola]
MVLDAVDFSLHSGERVALTGANGAGKTTLFHLLMGLKKPSRATFLLLVKPAAKSLIL